jgi:hypothetical protein
MNFNNVRVWYIFLKCIYKYLSAENIILVVENLEEDNNMGDEWKLVIEGKGLRITRNKIE